MRKRILCEGQRTFGGDGKNPCHKVLCQIDGNDITEEAPGVVVVRDAETITLKCATCKTKTTIQLK